MFFRNQVIALWCRTALSGWDLGSRCESHAYSGGSFEKVTATKTRVLVFRFVYGVLFFLETEVIVSEYLAEHYGSVLASLFFTGSTFTVSINLCYRLIGILPAFGAV